MLKKNQLTWTNIKHFIKGNLQMLYFKYIMRRSIKKEIETWSDDGEAIDNYNNPDRFKQVVKRFVQVQEKSPECIANGECKYCGCAVPAMLFSDKICEGKCYEPFK